MWGATSRWAAHQACQMHAVLSMHNCRATMDTHGAARGVPLRPPPRRPAVPSAAGGKRAMTLVAGPVSPHEQLACSAVGAGARCRRCMSLPIASHLRLEGGVRSRVSQPADGYSRLQAPWMCAGLSMHGQVGSCNIHASIQRTRQHSAAQRRLAHNVLCGAARHRGTEGGILAGFSRYLTPLLIM